MENSILASVKKILGLPMDYTPFDPDIIINVNAVFLILFQIGVGDKAFSITDECSAWTDFTNDEDILGLIKAYVPLKVRMMWDIPTSSAQVEAYNRMIAELESRISMAVDPGKE